MVPFHCRFHQEKEIVKRIKLDVSGLLNQMGGNVGLHPLRRFDKVLNFNTKQRYGHPAT